MRRRTELMFQVVTEKSKGGLADGKGQKPQDGRQRKAGAELSHNGVPCRSPDAVASATGGPVVVSPSRRQAATRFP